MILSILLGFILGLVFIKLFKQHTYHGPNSNIIQKNIYQTNNNEYYKFIPKVCICPL